LRPGLVRHSRVVSQRLLPIEPLTFSTGSIGDLLRASTTGDMMLRAIGTEGPRLEETSMHVAAILKVKGRNVVTTTADKSLLDVAKLLEQHNIGCIVIEANDGKVAGIVSERDIVRAIGQSGAKVLKEPVSVYMTETVVTAREADTIDRLMSEMTVHRFRHMPVVEKGRLIGLVSIGDVVKMRIAEVEMEAAATRQYTAG
jgi:CBS domain-containing protein